MGYLEILGRPRPRHLPAVHEEPGRLREPDLRLVAGEAAPGLRGRAVRSLGREGGRKTSDGVTGGSILDVEITAVDQRTALCIGSANEVDRFNEYLECDDDGCNTSK